MATHTDDENKTVTAHFECLCCTTPEDITAQQSMPTCGGVVTISVTDIQSSFLRGVKATVLVRHPLPVPED